MADGRYQQGEPLTEADGRLFTTLARFDTVDYSHFKCSRHRLEDILHLSDYLRQPRLADRQ